VRVWSCILALWLAALPAMADTNQPAVALLVLDPLAKQNACACVLGYGQRNYEPLARHLGAALQMKITPVCSPSLAGAVREASELPVALIVGKRLTIEHDVRQPGAPLTNATLVAALTDRRGGTLFQGLIVVRSDDRAQSLADLKGRAILFGPANSPEKHAAVLAVLREAGVRPATTETRPTCTEAAVDVASGKADGAAISSYAMPLLEGCKSVKKGELRIIGRTAELPFIGLYVTGDFPAGKHAALTNALQQISADEKLLDALESREGFLPVHP